MREDQSNSESEPAEPAENPDAGLSRAERRAKARGKGMPQQAHGQPHFVPKNNQGGARRNYSNRRSGG